MQTLNDYLNKALGAGGVFQAEHTDAQTDLSDIGKQIADQNALLSLKQQSLQAQFTAMEIALGQLQQQSGSLASSLGAALGSTRR
jgi:flagellar capping protein FliD